ncbi:MAG: hypothetical protein ACPGOY_13840 [Rhodospirillaceae bacterium]
MANRFDISAVIRATDRFSPVAKSIAQSANRMRDSVLRSQAAMTAMRTGAGGLASGLAKLGGAFALAGGGAAFMATKMTNDFAESADQVAKISRRLRGDFAANTDFLQGAALAAEEAGASAESFFKGVQTLTRRVGRAAEGRGALFSELNGSNPELVEALVNADSLEQQMAAIREALAQTSDVAEQTRIAAALVGDERGALLLSTLTMTEDQLRAVRDEADRLGLIIDPEALQNAELYNDTVGRLMKSLEGLRNEFAAGIIPVLTDTASKFTDMIVAARQSEGFQEGIADATKALREAFGGLSSEDLGKTIGSMISSFARLTAAMAKVPWAAIVDGIAKVVAFIGPLIGKLLSSESALIALAGAWAASKAIGFAGAISAALPLITALGKGLFGIPVLLAKIGPVALAAGGSILSLGVSAAKGTASAIASLGRLAVRMVAMSPVGTVMSGGFSAAGAAIGATMAKMGGVVRRVMTAIRLAMLSNPFTALVLAGGVAVAALIANWDEFKAWLTQWSDRIGKIFGKLGEMVSAVLDGDFSAALDAGKAAAKLFADHIKDTIMAVPKAFAAIIQTITGLDVSKAIKTLKDKFMGGLNSMLAGIDGVLEYVGIDLGDFSEQVEAAADSVAPAVEIATAVNDDMPEVPEAVQSVSRVYADDGGPPVPEKVQSIAQQWEETDPLVLQETFAPVRQVLETAEAVQVPAQVQEISQVVTEAANATVPDATRKVVDQIQSDPAEGQADPIDRAQAQGEAAGIAVGETLTPTLEAAQQIAEAGNQTLRGILDGIADLGRSMMASIQQTAQSVINVAAPAVNVAQGAPAQTVAAFQPNISVPPMPALANDRFEGVAELAQSMNATARMMDQSPTGQFTRDLNGQGGGQGSPMADLIRAQAEATAADMNSQISALIDYRIAEKVEVERRVAQGRTGQEPVAQKETITVKFDNLPKGARVQREGLGPRLSSIEAGYSPGLI